MILSQVKKKTNKHNPQSLVFAFQSVPEEDANGVEYFHHGHARHVPAGCPLWLPDLLRYVALSVILFVQMLVALIANRVGRILLVAFSKRHGL